MLRAVGYDCYLPSERIKDALRNLGCDTVLDIRGLTDNWGYDRPMSLPDAPPMMMDTCDLYVEIKAHRSYSKVVKRWSHLKDRMLWYRINGGRPEIVPGCGDELNPPCPILTPNQWYNGEWKFCNKCYHAADARCFDFTGLCPKCQSDTWNFINKAYCCWPPFYRVDEYFERHGRDFATQAPPICLIHSVKHWGYGELIEPVRQLNVRCYGGGDTPDGLVKHRRIPQMLHSAKAMVHLKSSDAPGYAIYECLAAACPLICTGRLIARCQMQDLLIPGETCLTFDNDDDPRPNEGRKRFEEPCPLNPQKCVEEVKAHLASLANPEYNRKIGMAGYHRLKKVMWSENSPQDIKTLADFLKRNFP